MTGLLGWGEHLAYDTRGDTVESGLNRDGSVYPPYHEMKRELLHWELLHGREPQRMVEFARGLWDHQIHDQETATSAGTPAGTFTAPRPATTSRRRPAT